MQKLNLPAYDLKLKHESGKTFVFDIYRKKYLVLTPEEEVRQLFSRYLTEEKKFPSSLMMTEHTLKVHRMVKRCDIIIFNRNREPMILVECKSPDVRITQDVFDQVARYNITFRVSYLVVTNGLKHYCCKVDYSSGKISFLDAIPTYNEITEGIAE